MIWKKSDYWGDQVCWWCWIIHGNKTKSWPWRIVESSHDTVWLNDKMTSSILCWKIEVICKGENKPNYTCKILESKWMTLTQQRMLELGGGRFCENISLQLSSIQTCKWDWYYQKKKKNIKPEVNQQALIMHLYKAIDFVTWIMRAIMVFYNSNRKVVEKGKTNYWTYEKTSSREDVKFSRTLEI